MEIVKPLDSDGFQDEKEREFVNMMIDSREILEIRTFLDYLKGKAEDGEISEEELRHSKNFSHFVKKMYNEVSDYYFIIRPYDYAPLQLSKVYLEDKIDSAEYISKMGLKLGVDKNLASNEVIKTISYYGIAVKKDNLQEDLQALNLLIKGVNVEKYGSKLVDFEPIVIKDAAEQTITIESFDRARDTWMIANLLKHRPELIEQPKKFEWINRMMQQVAYSIFDSICGPNDSWIEPSDRRLHRSENLTPKDERVWGIILRFHDYMNELPSKMERDNLPVYIHYWDSDLLEKEISDKTNRTVALFYLAELPARAFNREENFRIETGLKAMEVFVKRLPQMYEWIVNAWKNPECEEYKDAMEGYKMWLQDRRVHGLENTVLQFSGDWPYQQEGSIDDFLNKNFFA